MKRIIKIALGLMLAGSATVASAGPNLPTKPIETKYHADGPWQVATIVTATACDHKQDLCDIYYPVNLGQDGYKHPIVAWANGTGDTPIDPSTYAYFLRHLASWGFVVIATRDGETGYGDTILDSIAYMKAQAADPTSPFYDKLDTAHVGTAGHSQGATGAVNAMLHANAATPNAIQTAVSFHIARQSFCNPADLCLLTADLEGGTSGSIFYVSGTSDILISPDKQLLYLGKIDSNQGYYDHTPSALIKAKAILKGPNHNDIQGDPSCSGANFPCSNGVDGYLGYPTAWLMWRLAGAADGQQAFKANGGEIFSETTNWKSVVSNMP